MNFFKKFSIPKPKNKIVPALNTPKVSPIIGGASTFKTLATFDIQMDKPKYDGDIPQAEIKYYDNFN